SGPAGDALNLLGGTEDTATFTFTTSSADGHDGTIALVNGATTANYAYAGLSPISNTGTSSNIIFNLPSGDGDNQAILEDNGNLGDGLSQLRSGNGTFETTAFANPTASLTVNTGDDGETVTSARLDGGFTAPIAVNGGAGADRLEVDFAGGVNVIP